MFQWLLFKWRLDSSIVTTIAKQHTERLHTFTIGFDDLSDPYSRAKPMKRTTQKNIADQLGTIHTTLQVSGNDFLKNLRTSLNIQAQPFAVFFGIRNFIHF